MTHLNIETLLDQSLTHHLNQPDGRVPKHLIDSIRYSLLSPGKRIRPRLLLESAEMVGLSAHDVAPAALSLEMIHCFTLIHDDLPCMDDDDFRRGMPSNHKKFGEGTALLAGDALVPLAMEVFLDSRVETTALLQGLRRILWATGPRGVIGGQAAEELLGKNSSIQDLSDMHAQKTGALFTAALLIPKDFAKISDDSELGKPLCLFAKQIGLAFQIADDLEDGFPTQAEIEPTSVLYYLSPSEAGKMTTAQLQTASEKLVQAWGNKALGLKEISDEVVEKIEKALSKYST